MRKSLLAAALGGLLVVAGCSPDKGQSGETTPSPQKTEDVQALLTALQTKPYAAEGTKTCLSCHTEAAVSPILQSAHAVQGDPRTPFGQHGCESCHGPSPSTWTLPGWRPPTVVFKGPTGSPAGVQQRSLPELPPERPADELAGQPAPEQQSGLRQLPHRSMYEGSGPGEGDPARQVLHLPRRTACRQLQVSHHPIREGKVVCADCHNPHGSPGPKLLKEVRSTRPATTAMPKSAARCCGNTSRSAKTA